MKTQSRILLSVVSSVVISIVIAFIAFTILRGMHAEVTRAKALYDIINKTNALHLLTASIKEESGRSDIRQVKETLRSLDTLFRKMSPRAPREKILIKQLHQSHQELGPLIEQLVFSGQVVNDIERERLNTLASQIRIKVQFISDDTNRLRDITQSRMIAAQKKAVAMVIVLFFILALTNAAAYFLSGRGIVAAEESLREAHTRALYLARFPDENRNPVLRVSKDGSVLYCNRSAEGLPGWKCAVGQPLDSRLQALASQAMAEGKGWEKDIELENRFYSVLVMPFPGEGYSNVYGRDITDRKRAEEALRESAGRLQTTLDAAPAIIMTAHDRECSIISGNRAAESFFRVPEGTNLLKNGPMADRLAHYRIFHEGVELKPEELPIERVIASGMPLLDYALDFTFDDGTNRSLLGNVVPVLDGSGQSCGAIAAFLDITERKRAEESLRESERRESERAVELATLLDLVPVPVIIAHDPDSRHMTGNRAADELLRNPRCAEVSLSAPEEKRPRHFWAFKDGRELRNDELPAQRAARGVHVKDFDFSIVFNDGTSRDVVGHGTPLTDEQGRPRGAVHVLVDITERKQMEEDLRRSRDELERRVQDRTVQLRERARQLARLSTQLTLAEQHERRRLAVQFHDHVQQQIAAAKIHVELLARQFGSEHQENFENIIALLFDSLNAARTLSTQMAPYMLYERGLAAALEWLARSMWKTFQLKVEANIDPEINIERKDLEVLLFESARELLYNVVKHAHTSSCRLSMALDEAGHLRIAVSDAGKGFDPERVLKGVGQEDSFGLFSIKERMDLAGGNLEIESSPGKGATLSLVVTIAEAAAAKAAISLKPDGATPKDSVASAATERKIRILLADDHVVMRQGLSSLLRKESDLAVIEEAADGEEAVQMARKLLPDVILMDNRMPKRDGAEATRIIHSEFPHIRIIGLSMYDDADTKKAMLDAGAVAFMTKSSHSEALLTAIRDMGTV